MPTSRGSGSTPGEALQAALDGAGGASWTPPKGRRAQSVHARVRALVRTGKGYGFLLATGLNPRQSTLVNWLSGISPSKDSTRKINKAYENYYQSQGKILRGIPGWVRSGETQITGLIETERGHPRDRTLTIDNGESPSADWDDVEEEYRDWDDPDILWNAFLVIIHNDIDFSVLDFPGKHYVIELLS